MVSFNLIYMAGQEKRTLGFSILFFIICLSPALTPLLIFNQDNPEWMTVQEQATFLLTSSYSFIHVLDI